MATELLEKFLKKKIDKKNKPFIDNNLQIQMPDLVDDLTPIEAELNATILEAQQSHAAWKKMQTKLAKLISK